MTPSTSVLAEPALTGLPDHTQLPCEDGVPVQNFLELPQSILLTGSLTPWLHRLHPDGQFCIGQDCGIYWRSTTPPLDGCKAPDWFYVAGVPPMLNGTVRRSYVLWHEAVRPTLLIEYVSGDGSEEHDTTPYKGKFWVYEQAISAPYYVIYDVRQGSIEVYHLRDTRYEAVATNAASRVPVETLGIEFGLWEARYMGMDAPWLRVWDTRTGLMLPSTEEREAKYQQSAQTEKDRADLAESLLDETRVLLNEEAEHAKKLADKLRALGIDPDAL